MDRQGFEFDLITQRFLENRWETELGELVLKEVLEGIKNGSDVRSCLDPYVLNHEENSDPYGHPHYPKSAMGEGFFWVLTQDDLRGIHFYNEEFSEKSWLGTKSLNYARFYNCKFTGTNFERTSLTHTVFEECDLQNSQFPLSGGYCTKFIKCNLTNSNFYDASLIDTDLSGSDLTGVFFEKSHLKDIIIDYNTKFDLPLLREQKGRKLPREQEPELLKSIRLAYSKAEIWDKSDNYLYLERKTNRKNLLWQKLLKDKTFTSASIWFKDYLWSFVAGYGVKPMRIWFTAFLIALIFSFIYYYSGNPNCQNDFSTSVYYSFTTFSTLGYGDLSYSNYRWIMRLVSMVEAWCGAVMISMFVAVMARKVLRY